MNYPFLCLGAKGLISVASNLTPTPLLTMLQACKDSNFSLAKEIHYNLLPLVRALFLNTNPIPIKEALYLCGKIQEGIPRLPLSSMENKDHKTLLKVLNKMKLTPNPIERISPSSEEEALLSFSCNSH